VRQSPSRAEPAAYGVAMGVAPAKPSRRWFHAQVFDRSRLQKDARQFQSAYRFAFEGNRVRRIASAIRAWGGGGGGGGGGRGGWLGGAVGWRRPCRRTLGSAPNLYLATANQFGSGAFRSSKSLHDHRD